MIRHIKGFSEIAFCPRRRNSKRKTKKQKSPELEEGTHLVTESFLFCQTRVLRLYNGGISSGSEKLIFLCFLFW